MSTARRNPANDRHPAQWLALVLGVTYTLVGLAGFAVTGFEGFADPDGELLLGVFEVNPLHNLVHLALGLGGLALWGRLDRARLYGWLLVVLYGPTLLYGLFVANSDGQENFLALNEADNWLHAVSVLAGLAIALWPERRAETGGTTSGDTRARVDSG